MMLRIFSLFKIQNALYNDLFHNNMLLICEYIWRFILFFQIDTTVLIMKKKDLKVLNEVFWHNHIIKNSEENLLKY